MSIHQLKSKLSIKKNMPIIVLILLIFACVFVFFGLATINLGKSSTHPAPVPSSREAAEQSFGKHVTNENNAISNLVYEEKFKYISIKECKRIYAEYSDNPNMRSRIWTVVDPKNGHEYSFNKGRIRPLYNQDGTHKINKNWKLLHKGKFK